jgi:hypothetical protein
MIPMRKYEETWRLLKFATKDKPLRISSHPGNHARIQQALAKEKSRENRIRLFSTPEQIPHGRIIAVSEGRVLTIYLDFVGEL